MYTIGSVVGVLKKEEESTRVNVEFKATPDKGHRMNFCEVDEATTHENLGPTSFQVKGNDTDKKVKNISGVLG